MLYALHAVTEATLSCYQDGVDMTSCWAAEENCCVHCKHGDIQQGFGPRTFILCACCQDRGSHVECEEKATGMWSLIAAAAHEWPQLQMRRDAKQDNASGSKSHYAMSRRTSSISTGTRSWKRLVLQPSKIMNYSV